MSFRIMTDVLKEKPQPSDISGSCSFSSRGMYCYGVIVDAASDESYSFVVFPIAIQWLFEESKLL